MTCHVEGEVSVAGGQVGPSYIPGVLANLDGTKILSLVTSSLNHLGD